MINKDVIKVLSTMQSQILLALQNGSCYELAEEIHNTFKECAEMSKEPELLKKTAEEIKMAEDSGAVEGLFWKLYNAISFFLSNINYSLEFIEDNLYYTIVIEMPYTPECVNIGCDDDSLSIFLFGIELLTLGFPKQIDRDNIKIDYKNGLVIIKCRKV